MDPSSNSETCTNTSDYAEGCQVYEARLFAKAVADEDEDEGEEDGWVDCYFGYGEGFGGPHCGRFADGLSGKYRPGECSNGVYIDSRCL